MSEAMTDAGTQNRPSFLFLAFCDYIWQRLGHEGSMSNKDWDGLSLEERQDIIRTWQDADRSLDEAKRLYNDKHRLIEDTTPKEQIDGNA